MRYSCLAVLLTTSLFAASVAAQQSLPVTAFVDVTVIPMDRERVLRHQTVVVRGEQIVALGPTRKVEVPAGAVRIDGQGKFLLPGLADMHAHIPARRFHDQLAAQDSSKSQLDTAVVAAAERELFMTVANGVTTVRIMHGWANHLTLRARAARGELLSPRIYVARRALDTYYTLGDDPAADAKLIVADVEAAKAAGYDFYKTRTLKGGTAAFDSLVAVAHRVGLRIVGHAPSGPPGDETAIRRAIESGYASIEHMGNFLYYLDTLAQSWTVVTKDMTKVRGLAAAMHRAGVWFCPTIHLSIPQIPLESDPLRRYYRPLPVADRQATPRSTLSAAERHRRRKEERAERQGIRKVLLALRDAGVKLLLGTDEEAESYGLPGFTVHRELQALVQAGLTPYEALVSGTRNVAEFLGTLDSTGTVTAGKRADLVLLSGNPLHDIRHTAEPAGVMLGGRWLSRAELDARLKPLEGKVGGR